ncbi:MAG: preprotein translocase subunit YajC [Hespellia sp.]|jgi:preprotein translocase subunit YajC|nr:preprotein translocase subunit YajC [Hespellia sp.]
MEGILMSGGSMSTFTLVVIYVVFLGGLWFFMMRPQRKEQKRMQAMLAEMAIGDTVLTTSGFYGVIIDITNEDVIVEFGSNKNCRIPMQKSAIAQIEKPNAD